MHSRSDQPQYQAEPTPPRLKIVPVDDDLGIFALCSAAADAESKAVAEEECERKLAQIFSDAGYRTLAFERAAPRRQTL